MELTVKFFEKDQEEKWDKFVFNESLNGTFLQTRKFLNYHPDGKFEDCSLCVYKGEELVAVLPACEIDDEGKKTFFGHKGSTFGGICISPKIYNATAVSDLMDTLLGEIESLGFEKIYLKMVPAIYQHGNCELLDYYLVKNGFNCYNELNYYMNLDRYRENVVSQFSSSKRRDYKYSLKSGFSFKKLENKREILEFYNVLRLNLKKLNLQAVHSLDDLYDLKFNKFGDEIEFYGVYYRDVLVAGSMVFIFANRVFHTQYLSSNEEYLKLFPMDFLITNLIQTAVEKNMEKFSFGICTENQGSYLNLGLSRFKEGFGAEYCINRSYEKALGEKQ